MVYSFICRISSPEVYWLTHLETPKTRSQTSPHEEMLGQDSQTKPDRPIRSLGSPNIKMQRPPLYIHEQAVTHAGRHVSTHACALVCMYTYMTIVTYSHPHMYLYARTMMRVCIMCIYINLYICTKTKFIHTYMHTYIHMFVKCTSSSGGLQRLRASACLEHFNSSPLT